MFKKKKENSVALTQDKSLIAKIQPQGGISSIPKNL